MYLLFHQRKKKWKKDTQTNWKHATSAQRSTLREEGILSALMFDKKMMIWIYETLPFVVFMHSSFHAQSWAHMHANVRNDYVVFNEMKLMRKSSQFVAPALFMMFFKWCWKRTTFIDHTATMNTKCQSAKMNHGFQFFKHQNLYQPQKKCI